jgi:DNA (cytosine-5)-methyltransferase 1
LVEEITMPRQKKNDKPSEPVNTLIMEPYPVNKLRMIDLFAGTGAFTHAFTSTGKVTCVFANDMVPASEMIYNENFGSSHKLTLKNLHDVVVDEIPPHDILTGGFPCFVAGTKVLTQKGYKAIENVDITDTLLTHTGKFQRILNLQMKTQAQKLYNIDMKYHPHKLQCTEEHPFYVRKRNKVWDNSIRRYVYIFNKPEWVTASNLSDEYFTGMPVDTSSIIPVHPVEIKINHEITEEQLIELNQKDQWFMMGYFLGDGWIEDSNKQDGRSKHNIRFAINNKDEDYVVGRISTILKITDKKSSTGACKKIGCSDVGWYTILQDFGRYSYGKCIPEWVQSAPIEMIQEFLLGYQTADGCIQPSSGGISNHHISYTTISSSIAYGIQRLYLKLGKLCSITHHPMPATCVIEGRVVNQQSTYKMRVIIEPIRTPSSFIEDNYGWFKINSVSSSSTESQNVYNFEVENDNSYCVENTIVHNCQPFSIAGQQKGFEDERSNVFFKILAILDKHNPRCVVLENVKNLLTHGLEKSAIKPKKGEDGYVRPLRKGEDGYVPKATIGPTFQRIKTELENRGYTIHYKVLNTAKITNVPQHRERIYIVCFKNKELAEKFNLDFPVITKDSIESFLTKEPVPDKYYYTEEKNNKLSTRTSSTKTDEEDDVEDENTEDEEEAPAPQGKKTTWELVKEAITKDNTIYQYRRVYIRENKSNECPTLTANMGGGGHNVPLVKDKKGIRKLTPRECFQFQGFPSSYKLPSMSDSHLYKLAGNAVSVPVVQLIAQRLVPLLSQVS